MSAEVTDIGRNAILPEHGMSGADTSDGDAASTRDADNLAQIIDGRGGADGIAGQRRQFLHSAVRLPDDRPELQNLECRIARRIMNTILRPANDLAAIVRPGGVA